MKIGSLCTGYGGLDMAVEAYFNAETVWTSDIDKYASIVIDQRIKKPNLGNIKAIDWQNIEPIDILTAGYPCQPFSHAGNRKGASDERHIWPYIKEAIGHLRPRIVILENVRGHLSLGFKEVLKDLAEIGYDARWQIVRASDIGAPHQRARLFVLAYPKGEGSRRQATEVSRQGSEYGRDISIATDADSVTCEESRREHRDISSQTSEIIHRTDRDEHGIGLEDAPNTNGHEQQRDRSMSRLGSRFNTRAQMCMQAAPNPLVDGKLNAQFVEYMMGLPSGWVTDLEISRAQQLKILGNGVVPQQAFYALELLCQDVPCG
jgi:DNA (cytosine-5)-methyltransferase 1